MRIGAVLLAAGAGSRMSGENKMLREIGSKSVLLRSLQTLLSVEQIDHIAVVVSGETEEAARILIEELHAGQRCIIRKGGNERSDSVYAGLLALKGCDIAVVHDGARCFVSKQVVQSTIESAKSNGSGVAGMPAKDTIKRVDGTTVIETIDRSSLWLVQTPQTFRYSLLRAAYDDAISCKARATDDASFVERMGGRVTMVEGGYDNIKITTEEDILFAEAIVSRDRKKIKALEVPMRTGYGEDTHRLVEGRELVLGGVKIPFDRGLLGHSDADVLVHAVIDALLGAAALGDIGKLFPDSDVQYAGANSVGLLKTAALLLQQKEYMVGNIDVTVVAQEPKLAPHCEQMRKNIADALGTPIDRISIKATTSEGLGFEGRGEGITARCTALLVRD